MAQAISEMETLLYVRPNKIIMSPKKIPVLSVNSFAIKKFSLNKDLLCETVKDVIDPNGRHNPFKVFLDTSGLSHA